MAEMALGYGSEYQLLRFLGHHRSELNDIIRKNTKLTKEFVWLDFPKDTSEKPRLSLDDEYKDIDFLSNLKNYEEIKANWKNYWPSRGQHWDAIILDADEGKGEYVLVEAKAHFDEIDSHCQAENKASIKMIEKAFAMTKEQFNIQTQNSWFEHYYQLANRLAFINFMLENGMKASLLNIYFINGYVKRTKENIIEDKSVKNISDWQKKIDDVYNYLGINNEAKKYISDIFVNC